MSIRVFCERYDVGRTKANEEIGEGRLRARKAGRRTLIGEDDAEEWWCSLPTMNEVRDEATLEPVSPGANNVGPQGIDHAPSVPMGEVAKPLTHGERSSASKSRLGPTTTKHAATDWRQRRSRSQSREVRAAPSSESKKP
jgi:hypothetical protein